MKNKLMGIGLVVSLLCSGQDYPRKELNLEKLADEIFPTQELDLNYGELYENLAQIISNPMDLNDVTQEQLRALLVVGEDHINSFLDYRSKCGPLLSVYELQAIEGWDRISFMKVIPFVTVHEQQSKLNTSVLSRMMNEQNNYLMLRYERSLASKKGFTTPDSSQRYAGTPDKIYARFRVARSNDFSAGFTLEKDPGEVIAWMPAKKQYGFDYLSWHLQLQNKGRIKNLVAGDFQCQFGQGLIMGSAFGFGKNSESITTVRRSNTGFLPYTSVNENTFFRGLAATVAVSNNIHCHAFFSSVLKDATLNSTDETQFLTSFSNSGLHRTPAELRNRKQIPELNAGGVLQFKEKNLDAGIIFHHLEYGTPLQRTPFPYNQFSFNGSHNENISIYTNFSFQNFTVFSEAAQTIGHGRALTTGVLGSLSKKMELSLLFRDYSRDFYSFYSNAFSENTAPQNEQGLYWGWKYTFNKKYSASGYMDIFRFPWLRYRGYAPSEGGEWLLRFNYAPSKGTILFFQVREESKFRNLPGDGNIYSGANTLKRSFWVNAEYTANSFISFRTRVQWNTFELAQARTSGIAIIQDVSLSRGRWSFSFRYAIFDAEAYDNRLYVYEQDVWLAYSFPAYDGTGIRAYAFTHYKFSKKVDLWLRWSSIHYTDREQIGSGTETIEGNTGNDIKFQVRMRF